MAMTTTAAIALTTPIRIALRRNRTTADRVRARAKAASRSRTEVLTAGRRGDCEGRPERAKSSARTAVAPSCRVMTTSDYHRGSRKTNWMAKLGLNSAGRVVPDGYATGLTGQVKCLTMLDSTGDAGGSVTGGSCEAGGWRKRGLVFSSSVGGAGTSGSGRGVLGRLHGAADLRYTIRCQRELYFRYMRSTRHEDQLSCFSPVVKPEPPTP